MSTALTVILTIAGVIGVFALAVFYKVVVTIAADEIEGRLDRPSLWLLDRVRRKLPDELRVPLCDETWLPELKFILKREEERPVTRLIQSVKFSLGLRRGMKAIKQAAGPTAKISTFAALRAKVNWGTAGRELNLALSTTASTGMVAMIFGAPSTLIVIVMVAGPISRVGWAISTRFVARRRKKRRS